MEFKDFTLCPQPYALCLHIGIIQVYFWQGIIGDGVSKLKTSWTTLIFKKI